MNPTIPPPVPYCQASLWAEKVGSLAMGAAKVSIARVSCRNKVSGSMLNCCKVLSKDSGVCDAVCMQLCRMLLSKQGAKGKLSSGL